MTTTRIRRQESSRVHVAAGPVRILRRAGERVAEGPLEARCGATLRGSLVVGAADARVTCEACAAGVRSESAGEDEVVAEPSSE